MILWQQDSVFSVLVQFNEDLLICTAWQLYLATVKRLRWFLKPLRFIPYDLLRLIEQVNEIRDIDFIILQVSSWQQVRSNVSEQTLFPFGIDLRDIKQDAIFYCFLRSIFEDHFHLTSPALLWFGMPCCLVQSRASHCLCYQYQPHVVEWCRSVGFPVLHRRGLSNILSISSLLALLQNQVH